MWVMDILTWNSYIGGLVQNCDNSIANAMSYQSCAKPSIYKFHINTVGSPNIIKSPQTGVILCFQLVSPVSPSASTMICFSRQNVWAKTYIFGTKKVWVWEKVLDDLSVNLTQGHGCGIDEQKFACLQDNVRTTLPITTKLHSNIPLFKILID